jgi:predicted membrane chloride channel (bestrophin family)
VLTHPRLEEHVLALEKALGGCERILRTPVPTSYTRHTSRFLMVLSLGLRRQGSQGCF